MINFEICNLKSLSISEISKNIIKELKNNMDYKFIYDVEEKLLQKGFSKELIDELISRELSNLLLKMNNEKLRISKYELFYKLNKFVEATNNIKIIDANKRIYRLKVSLDEVDDKIYRIYDITATSYLSTLAYTILASFNTLAYHLYRFEMNGNVYHCDICAEEIDGYEINSRLINLNRMYLQKNDKLKMIYDFGCDWQFNIEVIDILEKQSDKKYPYIVEGKGKGIVEDEGIYTLQEFIKAKDKGKTPKIQVSDEEYIDFDFDYTEFDLDMLNQKLHSEIRKIKYGFEKN